MFGFDPLRIEVDKEFIEALREALADMRKPVELHVFKASGCEYCPEAEKLAKAVEEAAPVRNGGKAVRVHVHEYEKDPEAFKKHGVYRVPSMTLLEGRIKYVGVPAGEELKSFVETLIRVSTEESGLSKETIELLKQLRGPVKIEVIVTPPCPYCPYASLLANMVALEATKLGKQVVAETIEAFENPDIADKYGVTNVPAIAINGQLVFVGVPYEDELVKAMLELSK